MREVTLQEILAARDARAARQKALLAAYGKPLVGLNLNIAGPCKRSALSDLMFFAALPALRARLGGGVLAEEVTEAATGCEALLVCDAEAAALKALAVELEETAPAGRLLDLDVIAADGEKLSRAMPRRCIVCGGEVGPCARSRAHGLDAVMAATEKLLRDFAQAHLAQLGVQALIDEVELTPKPGLVDRRNCGAHRDMDLTMFLRSAESLRGYFETAVRLGMERVDCMPALQQAGLLAEETMFAATGGVNTHKGAVYAFGILLAALGSRLVRGGDVFETAAALAKSGIAPTGDTHGSLARTRYGAGGARGEACSGFPTARRAAAVLHASGEYAALLTLLAETEDTNLLYRGGKEGLRFVQREAAKILGGAPCEFASKLEALDDACIKRNLSPGGSADLLALALLLGKTRRIWE
ncbi:MAG: citrate lyase holo-[Oscillospiraceae bacterium]|nr:citrate lyase holo-[acyl-carrier protein] synthase [Oscillospiraceae bacterium]